MSRARRGAAGAAIAFALGLCARPSHAQSAEAEELFQQGRKALQAGDPATACARFDASERLERAVGTLVSLAACEDALGRLASARQHLEEAAGLADASHDPLHRGPMVRARLAALDKRVPRLTLKLAQGAPDGARIVRDDVELSSGALGVALPLNPGKHAVVVSANGYEPRRVDFEMAEGDVRTIEVSPGLRKQAELAGATAPAPAPSSPPLETRGDARNGDGKGSVLRLAGAIVGGVGVAGIGLGTYFGLSASSKWSSAKNDCKPGACGEGSLAVNERSGAETAAAVSTASFAVGGALLATGALLFLLAPSSGESPAGPGPRLTVGAMVGRGATGLSASGSF